MPNQNDLTTHHADSTGLAKRMIAGAAIAFLLISLFLLSAGKANPAWDKFWMVRPLIVVTIAGAIGGWCNYYIIQYHKRFGINKIAAIILSSIAGIVGLWLGTVLGLAGTMWH